MAVGKDGNNAIFPIAWATAEIENKDNWCWFLESLLKALAVFDQGEGLTFMSDRQKVSYLVFFLSQFAYFFF